MKASTAASLVKKWELYKSKIFLLLILVLLVLSLYVFQRCNFNTLISWDKLFKDPGFIGIFGSLIGALVGGLLSLFVSIYIQKEQVENKSAITRRNVIYTPLYNELVSVRNILKENPYPMLFSFEKGDQTLKPHPQFNIWERIKSDTRSTQVPKFLATKLEEYTASIIEYLKLRPKTSVDIKNKVNEILNRDFGTACKIGNIGDCIMEDVMTKNLNYNQCFVHSYKDHFNPKVQFNSEEITKLINTLYLECHEMQSVKDLLVIHKKSCEILEDLIIALESIVSLINIKYDSHKKFY